LIHRSDVVEPSPGTNLVLHVTGLAPWQADLDEVQRSSPYAGLRYFSLFDCAPNATAPTTGATSVNATLDWTSDPSVPHAVR
jgi:hypothetical protein